MELNLTKNICYSFITFYPFGDSISICILPGYHPGLLTF